MISKDWNYILLWYFLLLILNKFCRLTKVMFFLQFVYIWNQNVYVQVSCTKQRLRVTLSLFVSYYAKKNYIYWGIFIFIYKVVCVCLFVCLSDQSSGTFWRFFLKSKWGLTAGVKLSNLNRAGGSQANV